MPDVAVLVLSGSLGVIDSDTLVARWQNHDAAQHGSGRKRFNHPRVGQMTMQFQALAAPRIPGLTLYCYPRSPGVRKRTGPLRPS